MQDATEADILGDYFVLLKCVCVCVCTSVIQIYICIHTHQPLDNNSNVTSVLSDYFPIKDQKIT